MPAERAKEYRVKFLKTLFGIGSDPRAAMIPLYRSIVAEARQPIWYAEMGVPDTLDGRFETLALQEIVAFTVAANIPSRRVMGRLGMRRTLADVERLREKDLARRKREREECQVWEPKVKVVGVDCSAAIGAAGPHLVDAENYG